MNLITTQVDLDFIFNDSRKAIPIVQGDDGGRQLAVNLYNNGTYVDVSALTDTITISAEVNGKRTVTRKAVSVEEVTGLGTRAVIPITADLSRLSGVEHCVLRISSSNGIVHAAAFDLLVLHNPLYTNDTELDVNSYTTAVSAFHAAVGLMNTLVGSDSITVSVGDTESLNDSPPTYDWKRSTSEDMTAVLIARNGAVLRSGIDYIIGAKTYVEPAGEDPYYLRTITFVNIEFLTTDIVDIVYTVAS